MWSWREDLFWPLFSITSKLTHYYFQKSQKNPSYWALSLLCGCKATLLLNWILHSLPTRSTYKTPMWHPRHPHPTDHRSQPITGQLALTLHSSNTGEMDPKNTNTFYHCNSKHSCRDADIFYHFPQWKYILTGTPTVFLNHVVKYFLPLGANLKVT